MFDKKFLLPVFFSLTLLFVTACAPSDTSDSSSIPFPHIDRISLPDAYENFLEDSAVFLDVRGMDQYNQGHIPGSINIPLDTLPSNIETLDPEQSYITICT